MTRKPKVYVAGHNGMVGSSILRLLYQHANCELLYRSRAELDLTNQSAVRSFFEAEAPDEVYIAAAKVGGIFANQTYPAEFIIENLLIVCNIIDAAYRSGTKKLLYLGSSCIYPRLSHQPIQESALLSGVLEETNEPYAIAKIAGIKLCESYNRQYGSIHGIDYRSVMPSNLYGPGDNYHPNNSHVVPALIRRFHEAKINKASSVAVWGSGEARREFLFVDDLANACVHIMNVDKEEYNKLTQPMLSHINVGSGHDVTIKELAELIARIVGFKGNIEFDRSRPDGTPRKLLDSSLVSKLGWIPNVSLEQGLRLAYDDYQRLIGCRQ